ncbi:MAG: hypothetical protein R3D25_17040 [Geminicoccaceae bacterium]
MIGRAHPFGEASRAGLCRLKAVLLDTNLLILLVIGAVDPRWIGRHKRSRAFVASDWRLLQDLIDNKPILTTPHVLTEASNLLRKSGISLLADAVDESTCEFR